LILSSIGEARKRFDALGFFTGDDSRIALSERERIEVRDCCATVGVRCAYSINSNAASVFSVFPG
jgi:hypothetical protein